LVETGRDFAFDLLCSIYRFQNSAAKLQDDPMKLRFLWLLPFAVCSISTADEASHRESAIRILEITKADSRMQVGFQAMIDPVIAGMRQRGMPDAAAIEVREAFQQWFAKEIKWEEIKPKLVELYVKEFSESELTELHAFYKTPTGQKTIEKMPAVMQQSARVGNEYAQSKGESLQLRLKEIAEKYAPKKGQ
jgi:uncharacterized protein